jgi:hypothetical protein
LVAGPISIYLDLNPGDKPDLEATARAMLAFTAAVNELAYIIDPTLEVRIELESSTPGSLSLNSIIRGLKTIGKHLAPESPVTIPAVIATILVWFATDLRTTVVVEAVQHVLGETSSHGFSDAERTQIEEIVKKAISERIADQHVQGVYRALESDPAIRGVGSTVHTGERPADIVPREEFPARSGLGPTLEKAVDKRVKRERVTLTLVSPVLVPSLTRRWRFASSVGPISATMKDVRFLSRVLSGQERISMRANIQMDVLLETSEERQDEVWAVTDRAILQVTGVRSTPLQHDLFATPLEEEDDE